MTAESPASSINAVLPSSPLAGRRAKPRRLGRWLRRNGAGCTGLLLVLLSIIVAVVGPLVVTTSPTKTSLMERLKPPVFAGGTAAHPLGTDQLGRDVLSRLVHGARVSLLVGVTSTLISALIGVFLGLITGYFRGGVDNALMRIGDAQLSIPFLVLAISVVAVLGPGLINVILTLGIAGWIYFARVVRADTMTLADREFIESARAIGASTWRIQFRHLLPNIASSIIVMTTFQFAQMIVVESSLSFLGLGVPPPNPSWGTMINDGRAYMQVAWWLTTIPGLAILVVVLGANSFGDWLRDELDPRLRHLE